MRQLCVYLSVWIWTCWWGRCVPCNPSVWQPSFGGWFRGWWNWTWQIKYLPCLHQYVPAPGQRSGSTARNGYILQEIIWGFCLPVGLGLPVQIPEGLATKRPGLVLGYLFMVSQPNLCTLGQSRLHDSHGCVTIQVCSCSCEKTHSLSGPVDAVPLTLIQPQRAPCKHTYIHTC